MANPSTTKEMLEIEIKRRGLTQRELAKTLEITDAYLSEILTGKKSGASRYLDFASKLGLITFVGLQPVPVPERLPRLIPVISWVHAGEFVESPDIWPVGVSGEGDPVYSYVKTGPNAFGLRIEGDSMMPRFMPGDIAIVDPAIRVDNGSPCVIWVNGEVSLKLFWDRETVVILKPMNDKYPETTIQKDSKVDFRVVGKVVELRSRL